MRDVALRFAAAETCAGQAPELRIHLRDTVYLFHVTLHYRVHEAYDLIERCVTVTNAGDAPITIERIWSAQWHLPPGGDYRLTHVVGRHMDEMQLRREPLTEGIKELESRRLTTGHQYNPWFAVGRATSAL